MKAAYFIARRYLFSKKSRNIINVISWISVAGVGVASMGLVVVLSVFNGFGDLVVSLYNSFDPDIKVEAVKGKTFDPASVDLEALTSIEGISAVSFVLQENALVKYGDRQFIATIKGVDEKFSEVSEVGDHILEGEYSLITDEGSKAVVGSIVAYSLGMFVDDPLSVLSIYVPKRGAGYSPLDPFSAFNHKLIKPAGIFAIQQDFDSRFILVPIDFAREIIGQDSNISAIEIAVEEGVDEEQIRSQAGAILGTGYMVRSKLMQHDFLYQILKSEKWAVFMILSLILVISIFNIIGSLTMLIIEKSKDISVLNAMGATRSMVQQIFWIEGTMIVMAGGLAGMLLGFLICYVQDVFGVVRLDNAESFIIQSYPVAMQLFDFLGVFITILLIGFTASYAASKTLAGNKVVKLA
jgi:lipoprotein-releasing system permease protein